MADAAAASTLPRAHININYDEELTKIKEFLDKFQTAPVELPGQPPIAARFKYREQLEVLKTTFHGHFVVELDDVARSDNGDVLVSRIISHTKRYQNLFYDALISYLPLENRALSDADEPTDVLIQQRLELARLHNQSDDTVYSALPQKMLYRMYLLNLASFFLFIWPGSNICFKPPTTQKALAVREAKGTHIGQLISIRGMVTRISDVKPSAAIVCYTCSACNSEIFQEVMGESYTPLAECPTEVCRNNNIKGELTLQTRASRFVSFQKAQIQELTNQVPIGHIPRSMTVYLFDDQTRKLNPGDVAVISGVFLPKIQRGFRAMKVGLLTDTFLEVLDVELAKKNYSQYDLTTEIQENITALASDPNAYERLASSIAPEIFGHIDVKKALLLLMVGGVTNETTDGMKTRGDINVCLMGDPGVAKSQLLKWVARVAPRGVYTTGKGSSGVGLTAAVVKDPITGEMILEGGSLVLADNGICCIDEFDKMDESDRTAIHEVMEQQTISISKAGITTTLNARASILAAANPAFGRYNVNMSASQNINLPAALLSRFDLLFLITDKTDASNDERLAQHIVFVHRNLHQPDIDMEPVEAEVIRQYISQARQFQPKIQPELIDFVTQAYVQKRAEAKEAQKKMNGNFIYTQPRTLLAILRMSQSLARLRFSSVIEEADITEALRLMDEAKSSMETVSSDKGRRTVNPVNEIYQMICRLRDERGVGQLDMDDIRNRLRATGGFDEEILTQTVEKYEELSIWMRVGQSLAFV